MSDKEKLVELLQSSPVDYEGNRGVGALADHLIARGVTVQDLNGCCRCKDTSEMTVLISNKLIAGVRTGWLGGTLPAKFCPFCGRRLHQHPIENIGMAPAACGGEG